jgi:hypothetical protein
LEAIGSLDIIGRRFRIVRFGFFFDDSVDRFNRAIP